MGKEMENLDDNGCPNFKSLSNQMNKFGFAPATHSVTRVHFIVPSEWQMCLVKGQ